MTRPNLNRPEHQGALFLLMFAAMPTFCLLIFSMPVYQSGRPILAGVMIAVAIVLYYGVYRLSERLGEKNARRMKSRGQ